MSTVALLVALAVTTAGEAERIGVKLEEIQGVAPDEADALLGLLERSLEAVTCRAVALDQERGLAGCDRPDRCAAEIRARTGSTDVLLVSAFAAGTRVRLVAERVDRGDLVQQRIQADVARPWDPVALRGVAEVLFSKEAKERCEALVEPAPAKAQAEHPAVGPWPYVVLGAGGAAGVAAAILRVSANSIRDRLESEPVPLEERPGEVDRAEAHGLASNLLFGAGAVLVPASLVYLLGRP